MAIRKAFRLWVPLHQGGMAEGLGTGLQNRLRGFKSLCHLHFVASAPPKTLLLPRFCPSGCNHFSRQYQGLPPLDPGCCASLAAGWLRCAPGELAALTLALIKSYQMADEGFGVFVGCSVYLFVQEILMNSVFTIAFFSLSVVGATLMPSISFAAPVLPGPLPAKARGPELPFPSSDFVYTGIGPEVANPLVTLDRDFSAACYSSEQLMMGVARVGEYVHVRGTGIVSSNLEFLILTAHLAGHPMDLANVMDSEFTFEFVAPLSGGFIRSHTLTSSLSQGPYERKQILREVSVETGGYHSAPPVEIRIGMQGKILYQAPLSFQGLRVEDPAKNSMDEQINMWFRGFGSTTLQIVPRDCAQESLAVRP
jgi:hypothetical protein